MPTGVRRRTPTTTSRACSCSAACDHGVGDVGHDVVAHVDVEAAAAQPVGERGEVLLAGVAVVDQAVAGGGVDDDQPLAALAGGLGGVLDGGSAVGVGAVAHDDGHVSHLLLATDAGSGASGVRRVTAPRAPTASSSTAMIT